ncbi:MAG: D-alanyl-D-alanine carboxypeptidase [Actinomycetota bacterium]|nr:D-alanyl-D-alanine carboxypeptidase [Actinomycetota bacterium]
MATIEGVDVQVHRFTLFPAMVCLVLLLSACDSSQSTAGGTGASSSATGTGGAASSPSSPVGCVPNPEQVAAKPASPTAMTSPLPAELVGKLDAAARKAATQIAASGVIVGVRAPTGSWTAAYGQADPSTNAPMAVGMHTRIGSITKTFTGTLILQLAQQGRLTLDDTIDTYVDGVPNGDRVTLRMLANMTSGVASYTFSPKFTDVYFADPATVFTPDQVLAIGLAEPAMFAPGAQFSYSNTNTVLLGKVIEKLTGRPVEEAYRSRIFAPLGLANTSYPGASSAIPEPHPQGFTLQGDSATPDRPSNATNWNPQWAWTAGELISTMSDLLTYGRALGTGQGLLDEATQVQRLTSFPDPASYSYGLAAGCGNGWVGHMGELPGYNTALYYDTTTDTTVAVQTNSDIANGDCTTAATLTANPAGDAPCSIPAARVFQAIADTLGHPINFPTMK